MLRAMKFSESGLKCWPCQCVLVISWTCSSRGNYLWKISYPGNVTESREEGGGVCVGRESNLIGNTPEGISSQRNRNKLRRQCETISQAHFTLCLDNSKKNKVLVTVKSFPPVYLSILISSRVLILIGESR